MTKEPGVSRFTSVHGFCGDITSERCSLLVGLRLGGMKFRHHVVGFSDTRELLLKHSAVCKSET